MGCEQGAEERCELCGAPAAVHCAADAAFLCAACDAKVHGANFLASRHRRTRLAAAASDSNEDHDGYDSATSSSSCVSTADSAPPPPRGGPRRPKPGKPGETHRRTPRAEAVLECWAKRMGVPAGAARRRAAAAAQAVRACGADVAAARVPLRVAMAAALWLEVAAAGESGAGLVRGDALRRLEACAHVPARVVVAVASSMALCRGRRRARVDDAAEGWDECSWAGPKYDRAWP